MLVIGQLAHNCPFLILGQIVDVFVLYALGLDDVVSSQGGKFVVYTPSCPCAYVANDLWLCVLSQGWVGLIVIFCHDVDSP